MVNNLFFFQLSPYHFFSLNYMPIDTSIFLSSMMLWKVYLRVFFVHYILQKILFLWCSMTGSNRRPHPCKGHALPAELIEHTDRFKVSAIPSDIRYPNAAVSSKTCWTSLLPDAKVSIPNSVYSLCSIRWAGMVAGTGLEPAIFSSWGWRDSRFSTPQYIFGSSENIVHQDTFHIINPNYM